MTHQLHLHLAGVQKNLAPYRYLFRVFTVTALPLCFGLNTADEVRTISDEDVAVEEIDVSDTDCKHIILTILRVFFYQLPLYFAHF